MAEKGKLSKLGQVRPSRPPGRAGQLGHLGRVTDGSGLLDAGMEWARKHGHGRGECGVGK